MKLIPSPMLHPAMTLRFAMTAAIIAGVAVLSACATERPEEYARREYEHSVADYENCISANQMSTCEGERRIMETNKRLLSATAQRRSK